MWAKNLSQMEKSIKTFENGGYFIYLNLKNNTSRTANYIEPITPNKRL